MNILEVRAAIVAHGGSIEPGINWTWAEFPNDADGQACFKLVCRHVDNRGYYPAKPDSPNPNLHIGGFRFRSK